MSDRRKVPRESSAERVRSLRRVAGQLGGARIAIAVLLLVSAALLARKTLRSERADAADAIEEPRRELSALGAAAGISLVLCAALGALTPTQPSAAAIAPLLPICALMIGLALVRSEQPFERA